MLMSPGMQQPAQGRPLTSNAWLPAEIAVASVVPSGGYGQVAAAEPPGLVQKARKPRKRTPLHDYIETHYGPVASDFPPMVRKAYNMLHNRVGAHHVHTSGRGGLWGPDHRGPEIADFLETEFDDLRSSYLWAAAWPVAVRATFLDASTLGALHFVMSRLRRDSAEYLLFNVRYGAKGRDPCGRLHKVVCNDLPPLQKRATVPGKRRGPRSMHDQIYIAAMVLREWAGEWQDEWVDYSFDPERDRFPEVQTAC
jgi:hypothetical protein